MNLLNKFWLKQNQRYIIINSWETQRKQKLKAIMNTNKFKKIHYFNTSSMKYNAEVRKTLSK